MLPSTFSHVLPHQMAKLAQQPLVQNILDLLESDAPMHAIQPLLDSLRPRDATPSGAPASGASPADTSSTVVGKQQGARKRHGSGGGKQKHSGLQNERGDAGEMRDAGEHAEHTASQEIAIGDGGQGDASAASGDASHPTANDCTIIHSNHHHHHEPSPIKQPPADWDNLTLVSPKQPLPSPRQHRNVNKPKRGALSMSLGGALQGGLPSSSKATAPPEAAPPLAQGPRASAWGRPVAVQRPVQSNPSLKDIQAQEAAAQRGGGAPLRQGGPAVPGDGAAPKRPTAEGVLVSLGDLIEARVERRVPEGQAIARGAVEERTVAWGGARGKSPTARGVSFADIQVCVQAICRQ